MPTLQLLKVPDGVSTSKSIQLNGESQVIGRDADRCQIVIPHHAVSREHAKITVQNGTFYIEDLRSRNHTFVNGKEVPPPTRQPLKQDDRIKICDFLFQFRDDRLPRLGKIPSWMQKESPDDDVESGGMTTIEASQGTSSAKDFLQVAPADRLRALLDISTSLSKTLELDPLLIQIADTLLNVFKQADRCFVLQLDDSGRPIPKVVKSRHVGMEDTRFSRTIVRKALESRQSFLSEDATGDTNLGPAASIAEFKIRSVMCVPLSNVEGTPIGAIQLDTQNRSKKFSTDDLNLLTIVANLASVAIEKARMHASVLAREKEQKEIELARTVLLGFLPQTLPAVEGYEFFAHYSPAQTVGGDYYDFVPLPGGRIAIVLGDVAGKGVPAALLVAKLSSEVKFSLVTESNPAKAISMLNDQMIRGGLQDRFVTLTAMILDPVAHQLVVINAGHMNPKLFRTTTGLLGEAIKDEVTGLPLGVIPGFEYEAATILLAEGDTITVYTDGVTDAMSPAGEMFGFDRADHFLFPEQLTVPDNVKPKGMGERLVAEVRKHANGVPQNDDIALVCFGRLDAQRTTGQTTKVPRANSTDAWPAASTE